MRGRVCTCMYTAMLEYTPPCPLLQMILRRSAQPGASCYLKPSCPIYHRDLFLTLWGPAIAALSYVFENGVEERVVQSAMSGFQKCAVVSAHYGLSDVFDNVIITLCNSLHCRTARPRRVCVCVCARAHYSTPLHSPSIPSFSFPPLSLPPSPHSSLIPQSPTTPYRSFQFPLAPPPTN